MYYQFYYQLSIDTFMTRYFNLDPLVDGVPQPQVLPYHHIGPSDTMSCWSQVRLGFNKYSSINPILL